MTDDDFRDGFGDELTDALSSRSRDDAVAETALAVQNDTRGIRTRRRVLASVVALVVALAAIGVIANQSHGTSHVDVATTPSTTTPSTATVSIPAGKRLVSYRGVHVQVPAAWPVVDGMHTLFCGGPFPATPTAFVGPQENGPPSCLPTGPVGRIGVWLQPAPKDDGVGMRDVITPSGEHALETEYGQGEDTRLILYHDVSITIGVGDDPRIADSIFDSMGFTPGLADTPAAGVCARASDADVMPTPERLTEQLVLEQGNITLNPPRSTDEPTISAAKIWSASGRKLNFEHYRLLLTRYSSKYPTLQNVEGSLTPIDQDRLMWVIYGAPISIYGAPMGNGFSGCGMWLVSTYDAHTGKAFGGPFYAPGP